MWCLEENSDIEENRVALYSPDMSKYLREASLTSEEGIEDSWFLAMWKYSKVAGRFGGTLRSRLALTSSSKSLVRCGKVAELSSRRALRERLTCSREVVPRKAAASTVTSALPLTSSLRSDGMLASMRRSSRWNSLKEISNPC